VEEPSEETVEEPSEETEEEELQEGPEEEDTVLMNVVSYLLGGSSHGISGTAAVGVTDNGLCGNGSTY